MHYDVEGCMLTTSSSSCCCYYELRPLTIYNALALAQGGRDWRGTGQTQGKNGYNYPG